MHAIAAHHSESQERRVPVRDLCLRRRPVEPADRLDHRHAHRPAKTGQWRSASQKEVLNIPDSARAFGRLKKKMGNVSFYKALAKIEARNPARRHLGLEHAGDRWRPGTRLPTASPRSRSNYTPVLAAGRPRGKPVPPKRSRFARSSRSIGPQPRPRADQDSGPPKAQHAGPGELTEPAGPRESELVHNLSPLACENAGARRAVTASGPARFLRPPSDPCEPAGLTRGDRRVLIRT